MSQRLITRAGAAAVRVRFLDSLSSPLHMRSKHHLRGDGFPTHVGRRFSRLLKKPATPIHNAQFPPALFELRRDLAEALRAKAGRMLNAQIQNDFEHWALGIGHSRHAFFISLLALVWVGA
jgi:hypothetical protein